MTWPKTGKPSPCAPQVRQAPPRMLLAALETPQLGSQQLNCDLAVWRSDLSAGGALVVLLRSWRLPHFARRLRLLPRLSRRVGQSAETFCDRIRLCSMRRVAVCGELIICRRCGVVAATSAAAGGRCSACAGCRCKLIGLCRLILMRTGSAGARCPHIDVHACMGSCAWICCRLPKLQAMPENLAGCTSTFTSPIEGYEPL